jgi:hypothetical protein
VGRCKRVLPNTSTIIRTLAIVEHPNGIPEISRQFVIARRGNNILFNTDSIV